MSIPQQSPWRTAVEVGVFDSQWADGVFAEGATTTPWEVARRHFDDGGVFCADLLDWLRQQGCDPHDIGRFTRTQGISRSEFLEARKKSTDSSCLIKGYLSASPAVPMPERSPNLDGFNRRALPVNILESHDLASRAWDTIKALDPPQVFRFGDGVSWVSAEGPAMPVVQPLTKDRFDHLHHRTIRWEKSFSGRTYEVEPPARVTKDMLSHPHPPIPRLAGVRVAPVFGPSGTLAVRPGYDPLSEMFIWPHGLRFPFVPTHPTRADVTKARHLIEYELLGDFPFDDGASRSHAVAAVLHPFVRPMILGATPLHLVDKPAAGTGAGLLIEAMTLPGLGTSPSITTVGKLEDERQFRMVALLRKGPIAVLLDNINKKLDSETLAAMITAPDVYEGRIVRTSETAVIPVRCLWLATGNNVQVSHEMARRCVLIRLDAGMEHPEEGRTFRHPHLMNWAQENRSDLVWAALVLVQAWVSEGMPSGAKSKGSFESWAETMSGIFEVCGIPGFLDNTNRMKEFSDPEADAWEAIVDEWWRVFGEKAVGASDILPIAQQHTADFADDGEGRPTVWGIRLRSKKDAVIAGKRIASAGKKQGAAQWRLLPVNLS